MTAPGYEETEGMDKAELSDWLAAYGHLLSYLLLHLAPTYMNDEGTDTLLFNNLRKELNGNNLTEAAKRVAFNQLLGAEMTWKMLRAERRGAKPQ